MDNDGSTLERLRQKLADLESAQRASGGTACAEFWQAPSPNTAGLDSSCGSGWPLSDDAGSGSREPAGGDAKTVRDSGREFAAPLRLDWSSWSGVKGRLAPTLAFAAGITALPDLEPTSLDEADLVESAKQLGLLERNKEVVLLRVVTEMESRGLASPGGLSRVDWLRSLDLTLTVTAAKAVVTCAVAFNEPRWHPLRDSVIGQGGRATGDLEGPTDDASPESGAAARVTVGKAAQVIDFHARLKPVADPDDLEQAVGVLIGQAGRLRPEELARLVRELSDQVRPPKDADDLDQKRRNARGLWFLAPNAAGMVGMTGTLDPEGAAIIKAALDPLSCPCPLTDDAGVKIEDDPRPGHQRRMDALIEIVARGVSSPGCAPSTDKAKIVVTIDFEALRDSVARGGYATWAPTRRSPGTGPTTSHGPTTSDDSNIGASTKNRGWAAGRGSGTSATGDVLTPATVRRMACDAAIIPVVLGAESQPLDVGRKKRLVTKAMRTLLWLRDHGCTFPGCSMPAQWTDAHHVRHWINGGETSVSNLALLCRRHHVYVHDKHLTATITDTEVTWHTWQHWRSSSAAWPSGGDGDEVPV